MTRRKNHNHNGKHRKDSNATIHEDETVSNNTEDILTGSSYSIDEDDMGPMITAADAHHIGIDSDPMAAFLAREQAALSALERGSGGSATKANSTVSAIIPEMATLNLQTKETLPSNALSSTKISSISSNAIPSNAISSNAISSNAPSAPLSVTSPTLPALYPKDLYRRPLDTPAMQAWHGQRTAAINTRESQAGAKLVALRERAQVRLQAMAGARREAGGEAKARLDEANANHLHLVGRLCEGDASGAAGQVSGRPVEEIDWTHMLQVIEAVHSETGRTGRPTDERNLAGSKMVQMIASMATNE